MIRLRSALGPVCVFSLFAGGFFSGCGDKGTDPNSEQPQSIRFTMGSSLQGVTPDSLAVTLQVGDTGSAQFFTYDWRTSTANRSLSASVGESFKISFKLYACKLLIAQGETSGVFAKELALTLNPVWSDSAVVQAKLCRNASQCLIADPGSLFGFGLAGHEFALPTSCDTTANYRWVVRRGNDTVLTGSGKNIVFVLPDTLKNQEVSVRVQLVIGDSTTEERKWNVKVLDAISTDRLKQITYRTDTTSKEGASQVFAYDSLNRLSLIRIYDTLSPISISQPVAAESVFYNDDGRHAKTTRIVFDGTQLDSTFSYDSEGQLISLRIDGEGSTTTDSLFYKNRKLTLSKRVIGSQLSDSIVYTWSGDLSRKDSVFTRDDETFKLSRVIVNRYAKGGITERQVWVQRQTLQAYKTEKWYYNALNSLAQKQTYTEGNTPTLEQTESYRLDDKGRYLSLAIRDEVLEEMLTFVNYTYEASVALPKGMAKMSANSTTGFSNLAGQDGLQALRFAVKEWQFRRGFTSNDR